jgi:hypothetical protein
MVLAVSNLALGADVPHAGAGAQTVKTVMELLVAGHSILIEVVENDRGLGDLVPLVREPEKEEQGSATHGCDRSR